VEKKMSFSETCDRICADENLKVLYGISYRENDLYADVTHRLKMICLATGTSEITIPQDDLDRYALFRVDPVFGVVKCVKVLQKGQSVLLDRPTSIDFSKIIGTMETRKAASLASLAEIHGRIALRHGSMRDEFPEQVMSVTFVDPEATVLEIGGNIGRNSLVLANILKNSNRLVVLESDPNTAKLLSENRDAHGFSFHVEASALSKRKLMQDSSWTTTPAIEPLQAGWRMVNTLSFSELEKKYGLVFNHLVADCEGALYYILLDDETILRNINTILIENDFVDFSHKVKVDEIFRANGFVLAYNEPGGWGFCFASFYQAWIKITR
jgi:FkbM family methyltransferase